MTQEEKLAELKQEVKTLSRGSGVYLMKAADGTVIYIGKAKDLRARVRSYFAGGDGRYQIKFLIKRVDSIETIVTDTEEQAFILERDLINKYKPKYNIRLKDDKSYLSIRIDENQEWPRLDLVRRVEQDGARYFGPYSFSYEVRSLLDTINRVIPLRTCSDTVFYNRQRPCLEYQIKRCAGPCCLDVSKEEYFDWVKDAVSILDGKASGLIKELERRMKEASENLHFEDAADLRDRISVLEGFQKGQKYLSSSGDDADVFAIHREESLVTLSVLQVRFGRISGNDNFSFTGVEVADEEVLESAIEQFYGGGREIPEQIILPLEFENLDFLRSSLKERRGGKVSFTVPQRGLKYRLLNLALVNAKQHFVTKFESESRWTGIAKELSKLFGLGQVPRRIECLDISNLQGDDVVGALVAFFDGVADRSQYRRYRISVQGKQDDFAGVKEVMTRRLKKGLLEDTLPDLFVIDGGKGQLNAALAAREETGATVDIVSLAKKPDRSFVPGAEEAIELNPTAPVSHFLARIRDEAHRFVLGFHRSTRQKRIVSSALDHIPGIGPERRRRLLRHFGSVEGIKGASAEEVAEAGRMPYGLAEKVLRMI